MVYLCFRITLDEISALLEEEGFDDSCNCAINVAIEPPIEEATANKDCDSDASDSEVTCNPDHLPRRILFTEVLPSANEAEMLPADEEQKKKP